MFFYTTNSDTYKSLSTIQSQWFHQYKMCTSVFVFEKLRLTVCTLFQIDMCSTFHAFSQCWNVRRPRKLVLILVSCMCLLILPGIVLQYDTTFSFCRATGKPVFEHFLELLVMGYQTRELNKMFQTYLELCFETSIQCKICVKHFN